MTNNNTLDELIQTDDFGRAAFAALNKAYNAVTETMMTYPDSRAGLSVVGDAILKDMETVTQRGNISLAIAAIAQSAELMADEGPCEAALVDGFLIARALEDSRKIRQYVNAELSTVDSDEEPMHIDVEVLGGKQGVAVALWTGLASNAQNN